METKACLRTAVLSPKNIWTSFSPQIVDEASQEAAIVDPVAPETVLEAVKNENVKLTTILTTHHHW